MKVLTVYTLTSHVLNLKAHITKRRMFLLSVETFLSLLNSVDPDQIALLGKSDLGPHCLRLY